MDRSAPFETPTGVSADTIPAMRNRQSARRHWRPRIAAQDSARYALEEMPLFGMRSIDTLSSLLRVSPADLRMLCRHPTYGETRVFQPSQNKSRVLDAPTFKTLQLHYRLFELLDRVQRPAFLHSATKGRSYVTNAAAHAGHVPVATMDLKRFYESTTVVHVMSLFRDTLQMANDLARLLTTLCTVHGHLPMGSPLSPLMSYFVHRDLFSEVAEVCAAKQITMTLYYDDLAFSGTHASLGLLTAVAQLVSRRGLAAPADRFRVFSAADIKMVTGVAIHGHQLKLSDAQHQGILSDIRDFGGATPKEKATLRRRLEGRIAAAHSVDPVLTVELRRLLRDARIASPS